MPGFHKEELPITQERGAFCQRATQAGGMIVAFEHVPKGDYSDLFKDLPGGRCQQPHWGYVFTGRARVLYVDHEEFLTAGQAYYLPPGHILEVLEDSDVVEFSGPAAPPSPSPRTPAP